MRRTAFMRRHRGPKYRLRPEYFLDPEAAAAAKVFARDLACLALLWAAYAAFLVMWQFVTQTSNFRGAIFSLWPAGAANQAVSRGATWSLTLVRGLTAVGFLIFAKRFGHRAGCLLSLGLLVASFPFALTPQMRDAMIADGADANAAGRGAYALFVLFRGLMAAGGTGILLAQAPLIAKLAATAVRPNRFARLTDAPPAAVAGAVCSLLLVQGVAQTDTSPTADGVASDWQTMAAAMLGLSAAVLVAYAAVSVRAKAPEGPFRAEFSDCSSRRFLYGQLLSRPTTWALLLGGVFALYGGIEPAGGYLGRIWRSLPDNAVHA